MYGRTWVGDYLLPVHLYLLQPRKVFNIANIFTVAFSLGCAFAPNAGSLIALRFLGMQPALKHCDRDTLPSFIAGLSGSAPIAIGGGSVSDLFSERDRASAMAMFSLGPLVGRYLGRYL